MSIFKIPDPDLQIEFYHRLEKIRESYLLDALLSAVSELEIPKIDLELRELVSNSSLQKMTGWGLRGEIVGCKRGHRRQPEVHQASKCCRSCRSN